MGGCLGVADVKLNVLIFGVPAVGKSLLPELLSPHCPLQEAPFTPNFNPNSTGNPVPSLGNNTTLEKIDGVIGYSYTCIDNGEVVVIYR